MPMKTIEGYSKEKYTNTSVLLAGGGAKALSDFIGSLSWDSTNKKIKYTPVGGSATDLVTLSWDNIINKPTEFKPSSHTHDTYVPKIAGTGSVVATQTNTYGWAGCKIRIPGGYNTYMIAFTLRIYSNYNYTDIVCSGYHYGSNHWYSPNAQIIGGTQKFWVVMGYEGDAANHLYVWFGYKESNLSYGGFSIINLHSGHSTGPDWYSGWEISNVGYSSLTNKQYDASPELPSMNGYTHDSLYVSALGTSGNYLTWAKNGSTNNITVPYATKAGSANSAAGSEYLNNYSITNPNSDAIKDNKVKWFAQINSSSGYAGNNYGFQVSNNANGILYLGTHPGKYGHQLGFSSNGNIYHRYQNGSNFPNTANGGSWEILLTSNNYTTYTVKKDGTGASGTWGISITGSAGSVAWKNVSDKPSTFTPSSHTHTKSQITDFPTSFPANGGNADTVDDYHATCGNNKPWGTIPVITTSGYMDVGKHFEFHFDNTTGSDYSTALMCTGNYSNIVNLPSASGTLALISDIPSVGNGTVTVTQDGSTIGSFTMNQSGNTLIALNDTNTNYYPIRSYTSGLQISSYSGSTDCALFVPYATNAVAGVVSTAAQSFAGQKTFLNGIKVGSISGDQSTDNAKIYFGDGKYVWIGESPQDDALMLNCGASKNIYFSFAGSTAVTSSNYSTYAKIYMSNSGAVYASSGFYESSDERLKNILNSVKVNLDDLAKLRKVYYLWNNTPEDGRQLGMIAQDVQKLYPELVSMDKNTGYLSLAYDKLSVIALEAIDTLYTEYKQLKERINELEKLLHSKEIL